MHLVWKSSQYTFPNTESVGSKKKRRQISPSRQKRSCQRLGLHVALSNLFSRSLILLMTSVNIFSTVICCFDCIQQWISSSPVCPHCRSPITIDACLVQPPFKPIFELIEEVELILQLDRRNVVYSKLQLV